MRFPILIPLSARKVALGRHLKSFQVLSENTCLNIPSHKPLETLQYF